MYMFHKKSTKSSKTKSIIHQCYFVNENIQQCPIYVLLKTQVDVEATAYVYMVDGLQCFNPIKDFLLHKLFTLLQFPLFPCCTHHFILHVIIKWSRIKI